MKEANAKTVAEIMKSVPLTVAEQRIRSVLLANYPAAGLDSVAQFAEAAQTSHPTVLRFIGKLGFSSYGDFQRAIRSEVADGFQTLTQRYDVYKQVRKGRSDRDDFRAAVHRNIDRAFDMLSLSQLERVSDILADERRSVFLTGSGLTYSLATWFFNYLKQLRPGVHYVNPGAKPQTYLLDLKKRDVVVLMHMPRYERAVLEFGRQVLARGSTLIVFTDQLSSAPAAKATFTFASPISVPSVFDSYIGSLFQIELLTAAVVQHMGAKYRERAALLEELIPEDTKVHDLDDRKPRGKASS